MYIVGIPTFTWYKKVTWQGQRSYEVNSTVTLVQFWLSFIHFVPFSRAGQPELLHFLISYVVIPLSRTNHKMPSRCWRCFHSVWSGCKCSNYMSPKPWNDNTLASVKTQSLLKGKSTRIAFAMLKEYKISGRDIQNYILMQVRNYFIILLGDILQEGTASWLKPMYGHIMD